jgi:hypothetical protein
MSELKHHGILGMKWGVRRWQNEDGSWTSAGRLRYGAGQGSELSKNIKDAADSGMSQRKIVKTLSRNTEIRSHADSSWHRRLITIKRHDLKKRAQYLLGEHASDMIQVGKHSKKAEDIVYKALNRRYRVNAQRVQHRRMARISFAKW